ncbi:unnamed protein product [Mycena citricolor]|uniref:Uncharacterized protein n=1 Tax=Mycena citricolor TaxID=2018698 RepID=A0AAD2HUP8_9AGAR|nr:unnamed protein product [Mycena citricolor]
MEQPPPPLLDPATFPATKSKDKFTCDCDSCRASGAPRGFRTARALAEHRRQTVAPHLTNLPVNSATRTENALSQSRVLAAAAAVHEREQARIRERAEIGAALPPPIRVEGLSTHMQHKYKAVAAISLETEKVAELRVAADELCPPQPGLNLAALEVGIGQIDRHLAKVRQLQTRFREASNAHKEAAAQSLIHQAMHKLDGIWNDAMTIKRSWEDASACMKPSRDDLEDITFETGHYHEPLFRDVAVWMQMIFYLIVVCSTLLHISRRGCLWVMMSTQDIVRRGLGPVNDPTRQEFKDVPTMQEHFNLDTAYTIHASCPACHHTHRPEGEGPGMIYPSICVKRDRQGRKCNTPLLQPRHAYGRETAVPIRPFIEFHFIDWLARFLAHPGNEKKMDKSWDRLNAEPVDLSDVLDGSFVRNFKGPDKAHHFIDDWPLRTDGEWQAAAQAYRSAAHPTQAQACFNCTGVRTSEFLRLPYYEPTKMIVVDPMHNLFLGLLHETFRRVLGFSEKADDGPAVHRLSISLSPTDFLVSEKHTSQVKDAIRFLETISNADLKYDDEEAELHKKLVTLSKAALVHVTQGLGCPIECEVPALPNSLHQSSRKALTKSKLVDRLINWRRKQTETAPIMDDGQLEIGHVITKGEMKALWADIAALSGEYEITIGRRYQQMANVYRLESSAVFPVANELKSRFDQIFRGVSAAKSGGSKHPATLNDCASAFRRSNIALPLTNRTFSNVKYKGLSYSTRLKHRGNSSIYYTKGGTRQPLAIEHIIQSLAGAEPVYIVCRPYRPLCLLQDPFLKYPDFGGKIWSRDLEADDKGVVLTLEQIEGHFASCDLKGLATVDGSFCEGMVVVPLRKSLATDSCFVGAVDDREEDDDGDVEMSID